MMTSCSATAGAKLDMQGFGVLDADAKSRYAVTLRFTPGVATLLDAFGLVLQLPI